MVGGDPSLHILYSYHDLPCLGCHNRSAVSIRIDDASERQHCTHPSLLNSQITSSFRICTSDSQSWTRYVSTPGRTYGNVVTVTRDLPSKENVPITQTALSGKWVGTEFWCMGRARYGVVRSIVFNLSCVLASRHARWTLFFPWIRKHYYELEQ
jgi:hypothetical protein